MQVQYNESLTQQQSRYNMELSSLRDQLHEAETHRDLLEREVGILPFITSVFIVKFRILMAHI